MALPLAALMASPPGRQLTTLDELLERPAWHADAACREHPEVVFIPAKGQPTAPAKAVCTRCLVHDECLAYALDHELVGVWGGTSTAERDKLRRNAA